MGRGVAVCICARVAVVVFITCFDIFTIEHITQLVTMLMCVWDSSERAYASTIYTPTVINIHPTIFNPIPNIEQSTVVEYSIILCFIKYIFVLLLFFFVLDKCLSLKKNMFYDEIFHLKISRITFQLCINSIGTCRKEIHFFYYNIFLCVCTVCTTRTTSAHEHKIIIAVW